MLFARLKHQYGRDGGIRNYQTYPKSPPYLYIRSCCPRQVGIQEDQSFSCTLSLSQQCPEMRGYIQVLSALPLGKNAVRTE